MLVHGDGVLMVIHGYSPCDGVDGYTQLFHCDGVDEYTQLFPM